MSHKETELIKRAARLAKQLTEVLDELASISNKSEAQAPLPAKVTFDENELRADFEKLRSAVEQGSEAQEVVTEFLAATSKDRLSAFIRANALPIVSKNSKPSVTTQLVQLLRQSKAIGAPVRSLTRPPSED